MKVRVLTIEEAKEPTNDALYDIEIELVVARINCILRRAFGHEHKNETVIPWAMLSRKRVCALPYLVINKFRNAGWIIREERKIIEGTTPTRVVIFSI